MCVCVCNKPAHFNLLCVLYNEESQFFFKVITPKVKAGRARKAAV